MKYKLIFVLVLLLVVVVGFLFTQNNDVQNNELLSNNDSAMFDNVPPFLLRSFPNTDFSKANSVIGSVLTGGPAKDGIPAIDEPMFIPLSEYVRSDTVQAIVLQDGDQTKVYPYNILTWHEIVNDTVDGTPVAITFCPLCGSAIVFNRELEDGPSTFGVSGALIESNMVMYDRATETLWQQSTGEALAGELFGTQLELHPFQLLTMGEVKAQYPDALVLSENTGHSRDYARNPYSGYTENDVFIFSPSSFDERFEAKEIMAVFRVDDSVAATPWLSFENGTTRSGEIAGESVVLAKNNGELRIVDETGTEYPFYFEMWFSFAVQNPDGIVIQ